MNPSQPTFLIIGSGRVAKHFQYFLRSLEHNVLTWARADKVEFNSISPIEVASASARLKSLCPRASHILLALSDSAIEDFIADHPELQQKTLVHFSGALSVKDAWTAHPLMAFTDALYDPDFYRQIPFIIERSGPPFEELLPRFPNPHYSIDSKKKGLYHALCVLGGNFSTLLWQEALSGFEKDLQLPAEVLHPYMAKILDNLIQNPLSALTGPLIRKDHKTIEQNLKALENTPLQPLYQAFVTRYCN